VRRKNNNFIANRVRCCSLLLPFSFVLILLLCPCVEQVKELKKNEKAGVERKKRAAERIQSAFSFRMIISDSIISDSQDKNVVKKWDDFCCCIDALSRVKNVKKSSVLSSQKKLPVVFFAISNSVIWDKTFSLIKCFSVGFTSVSQFETDFFVTNCYNFAISNIKRLLSDVSSIFRSLLWKFFFEVYCCWFRTPSHAASWRVKPEKKSHKGPIWEWRHSFTLIYHHIFHIFLESRGSKCGYSKCR